MKYAYREMPESLKGTYADFSKQFGFSWKETTKALCRELGSPPLEPVAADFR